MHPNRRPDVMRTATRREKRLTRPARRRWSGRGRGCARIVAQPAARRTAATRPDARERRAVVAGGAGQWWPWGRGEAASTSKTGVRGRAKRAAARKTASNCRHVGDRSVGSRPKRRNAMVVAASGAGAGGAACGARPAARLAWVSLDAPKANHASCCESGAVHQSPPVLTLLVRRFCTRCAGLSLLLVRPWLLRDSLYLSLLLAYLFFSARPPSASQPHWRPRPRPPSTSLDDFARKLRPIRRPIISRIVDPQPVLLDPHARLTLLPSPQLSRPLNTL